MKLEILKYPDPRLTEVSRPVEKFDEKLHKLLDDMAETMYAANGIGLAAPQVNLKSRIFVIDLGEDEERPAKRYEFINPKLSGAGGKIVFEEGCLSVPGFTEEVTRKDQITVDFQDRDGKPQRIQAEGLLAVAIQHENDHLDGIVFIERLSPLRRRLARRKLAKKAVTL